MVGLERDRLHVRQRQARLGLAEGLSDSTRQEEPRNDGERTDPEQHGQQRKDASHQPPSRRNLEGTYLRGGLVERDQPWSLAIELERCLEDGHRRLVRASLSRIQPGDLLGPRAEVALAALRECQIESGSLERGSVGRRARTGAIQRLAGSLELVSNDEGAPLVERACPAKRVGLSPAPDPLGRYGQRQPGERRPLAG